MKRGFIGLFALIWGLSPGASAGAAEVKVLTAGAMKSVLVATEGDFRAAASHSLLIENDTVGATVKKIEGGAPFDVAVLTPAAVDELSGKGLVVAGTRTEFARVGVGVMVKAGAAAPDVR